MTYNNANTVAIKLKRHRTPNPFAHMTESERNAEIEKLKKAYLDNGGTITRIPRGASGYRPLPRRGRQIRF